MSLAKELGIEYMDQFYSGSYFQLEGKIYCYKRHLDKEFILMSGFDRDNPTPKWETINVPSAKIKDMDVFAWPKLGYRQFIHPKKKVGTVYFVSSIRSAMRGLQDRHIGFQTLRVQELLELGDPREFVGASVYVKEIFNPKFTNFFTGLDQLRRGEACAFALSENLAVAMSVDQGPNQLFDVMYKNSIIGNVNANNEVIIPRKIAKRASSLKLFQGMARL